MTTVKLSAHRVKNLCKDSLDCLSDKPHTGEYKEHRQFVKNLYSLCELAQADDPFAKVDLSLSDYARLTTEP